MSELIFLGSTDVSPPVQRSSHKRRQGHTGGEGEDRSKRDSGDTSEEEAGPTTSKRSKPSGSGDGGK